MASPPRYPSALDPLFEPSPLRRRFASIEAAVVAGIERFYRDQQHGTAAVIWLQVLVFSTIAFLWFVGVVRGRLGDREPKLFVPRIATLVMFSTASLGRATGALPRWLVWLTFAIGIAELVNVTVSTPTIYLVPGWIALVSVVLLIRRTPSDFELDQPAPVA